MRIETQKPNGLKPLNAEVVRAAAVANAILDAVQTFPPPGRLVPREIAALRSQRRYRVIARSGATKQSRVRKSRFSPDSRLFVTLL
jgi:hypothetical protein